MGINNPIIHPKGLSQENLARLLKYGEVQLNAVQLARLIRTAPGYKKGQHIHLHSCLTGAEKNGIAQQLANRMKVPVSAFNKILWNSETSFWTHNEGGQLVMLLYAKCDQLGVLKTFYPPSNKIPGLLPLATLSTLLLSGSERKEEKADPTKDK